MFACELCGASGEGLGLREARLKEGGRRWVCRECWERLFQRNEMVSGSTGGGAGCGMSCPGCRSG